MNSLHLTSNEKKILTILDDAQVKDFENYAQKYVELPSEEIKKIVDKLKSLELIKPIPLSDENDLWYYHTLKVKEDMLDEELQYIISYSSE